MKRTKRILSMMISSVMAASFLAGCSSGTVGGSSAPAESGASASSQQEQKSGGDTINLKVWGAIAEEKGPGELMEAFMKENPGITVEYISYKNNEAGNTKLNTALIDGADVDVFINYGARNLEKRYQNLCEDLTSYMEKDNFAMGDHFNSGYILFDDKAYALPASTLKEMVYLNKTALDEAGLPVPDDNWTLKDFEEYATKLTKGSGADLRYGVVAANLGLEWTYFARGLLGSDFYYKEDGTANFDHPAFQTALETTLRMENESKVQESHIELTASKISYYTEFMTNRAAMLLAADPMMRYVTDLTNYPRDWTVTFANYPRFDESAQTNYHTGRGYFDYVSVAKNGKNKDAAWKLAKYWATEGSKYLLKYGRIPAWKQTDLDSAIDMIFSDEVKPLVDLDAYKRVVLDFNSEGYNDTMLSAYSEIDNIIITESEKAFVGMQSVPDTITRMKELADKAIAEAK